jgi:hypothetical protein
MRRVTREAVGERLRRRVRAERLQDLAGVPMQVPLAMQSAAVPATWGDAMLVPEIVAYPPPTTTVSVGDRWASLIRTR